MLNTIIIEDEPLARDLLKRWLNEHSDVNLLDEADCLDGAKRLLEQLLKTNTLIFLDINLLGENGFGLIDYLNKHVDVNQQPEIIFVTAYADYAVQAFRVNAVDYLHKPFGKQQLYESIQRASQRRLAKSNATNSHQSQRIAIKDNGKTNYILTRDIQWVTSAGGYCVVHINDKRHITRTSLQKLLDQLGTRFVRVHRSHIINLDHITTLKPLQHGDAIICLANGAEVRLSRRYRKILKNL